MRRDDLLRLKYSGAHPERCRGKPTAWLYRSCPTCYETRLRKLAMLSEGNLVGQNARRRLRIWESRT